MADDFQQAVHTLAGRLKGELRKEGVLELPSVVVEDIIYEGMPDTLTRKEDLLFALAILIDAHRSKSWLTLCNAWNAFSAAISAEAEKSRAKQRRKDGARKRDEANKSLQEERASVKKFVYEYLQKHPDASNKKIANYCPGEASHDALRKHWVPEFRKDYEREQSVFSDFKDISPP